MSTVETRTVDGSADAGGRGASSPVTRAAPLLALWLLGAAVLGGCDGGIFGTGDGGSNADMGLMGGAGAPEPGPGALAVDGDAEGAPDTDADDGAPSPSMAPQETQDADTAAGEPPASPIDNTLVGGTVETPRARVVNASTRPVGLTVTVGEVATLGAPGGLAPGTVGDYRDVDVEAGASALLLTDADDGETLYRFAPLNLGTSSVTTLLVRDVFSQTATGDGVPAIEAVALATLTASDDPAQARVRVALGGAFIDEADGPAFPTFTLVPGGESPGGAEVTFGPIGLDGAGEVEATMAARTASAYRAVPAGDYTLREVDGRTEPRAITLPAGGVYTLVVGGSGFIRVEDGRPGDR